MIASKLLQTDRDTSLLYMGHFLINEVSMEYLRLLYYYFYKLIYILYLSLYYKLYYTTVYSVTKL